MSREQRIFAHWKSFGSPARDEHEPRSKEQDNNIWLRLARVHKIPVRQIKDIVTAERARRKAEREG